MHLPALCVRHSLPDVQLLNILQVVTFLVETILSLHVEGFQPSFFVTRNYIVYSLFV